jgi:hypothetical protein
MLIPALLSSPLYKPDLRQTPLGTMLLEIITQWEVYMSQWNLFDCAKGRPFNGSIAQDPLMFEAITAFLIVLSLGILLAHALDAFRP